MLVVVARVPSQTLDPIVHNNAANGTTKRYLTHQCDVLLASPDLSHLLVGQTQLLPGHC